MTDNLEIWNKLRNVPKEHLKPFQRSGGFKGTAIKPMWSIHKMTETFGPCGQGWGIKEPSFQVLSAGDEILVYCTVHVWHGNKEQEVIGVGGDKVLVKQTSGIRSDDEAFKKAFTDAVTNALKHIGVGADVHMGLFDGSKYKDHEPDHEHKSNGHAAPSAQPFSHSSQAYLNLKDSLQKIDDFAALETWIEHVKRDIASGAINPSERIALQNSLEVRRAFLAQAPGPS